MFVSAYSVMFCVHCKKLIYHQHDQKMKDPWNDLGENDHGESTLSPWDCQFADYLLENRPSLTKRIGPVRCTVLFSLYIQDVCICQS